MTKRTCVNEGVVLLVSQWVFLWMWARKEVLSKRSMLVSATSYRMSGQFLHHRHVTAHSQGVSTHTKHKGEVPSRACSYT